MRRIASIFATIFFTSLIGLYSYSDVFAANPFTDIKENDPIYDSLIGLYEKGIVAPDASGKFHPDALMDRDEFVSIVVGVGCKKCLTPSADDILKYTSAPFVDFALQSKYFYCVSYAKEIGVVEGYKLDANGKVSCQDGKSYSDSPFCANNSITRIEAAAVLLRQAKLWTEDLNTTSFEYTIPFDDVDSYWYGYAQKAMELGIISYKEGKKIYPNEYITKREFVQMAADFFTINLCQVKETQKADLAADIKVIDKNQKCSVVSPETTFPDLTENTYCLVPEIIGSGSGYTYEWEFINETSKTKLTSTEAVLPNYLFPETGTWLAKLTVHDGDKSSVAYSQISIITKDATQNTSPLSVVIAAKPLYTPAWSSVDFSSLLKGGTGPYAYSWNFGDGSYSSVANPKHTYSSSGIYPVTLVITDANGQHAYAALNVEVTDNDDIDGDGVKNSEDRCPTVFGALVTFGCPEVQEYVPLIQDAFNTTSSSSSETKKTASSVKKAEYIENACLATTAMLNGGIFGKSTCSSCPCEYSIDFNASIRACDIVFPTILSTDKKTIYSRGSVYTIEK